VQLETDPERADAAERLDAIGMKSAGAGAGVDLGLDGIDAKIGQAYPSKPIYHTAEPLA
jgi:hypothetical protein